MASAKADGNAGEGMVQACGESKCRWYFLYVLVTSFHEGKIFGVICLSFRSPTYSWKISWKIIVGKFPVENSSGVTI